ncbi:hypothetical protein SNOG_20114 [Parastagonospora nodorum SN15]|uniref:Uncharacterized protein n=1 Tax=Phaeosphaeria nodorum (strain SN15 / ATCC MYA-4574 / FGSC 10173) TaxID=321614 RepID=A9JXB0_PHANO|nr:hypothetical protein SNOG_20114 [Parastagonospora nodorum SN15]EDP89800.1 hypothetical protein SNOG_20114 [Parastagonospora nodorum SN15]
MTERHKASEFIKLHQALTKLQQDIWVMESALFIQVGVLVFNHYRLTKLPQSEGTSGETEP